MIGLLEFFGEKRVVRFIDNLSYSFCPIVNTYGCCKIPKCLTKYPNAMKEEGRPAPPKGYRMWMHIFNDYSGLDYYVFYPKGAKRGDFVKVVFIGNFFKGVVEWGHLDHGLFDTFIWDLLRLEEFYNGRDYQIIDYIESIAVKYGKIR